ncbi:hypothetical protein Tco_0123204, partial [Tanacetum coccineum]
LFQPLFDKLVNPPPSVDLPAPKVIALIAEVVAPEPVASTGSPSATTVNQDAPSPSNSQTTPKTQSPIKPNDVEEDNHDLDVAHMNNDPFFGIPIPENDSEASSSSNVIPTITPRVASIFYVTIICDNWIIRTQDSVMSDSDESGVTHTEVSSPYEDLSDIDYVPGPEEPEQAPPSPDYVPGPEHDDDEIVAEDQPYAEDASPIAQSPDYVPETDPEADPEEDGDEDPEEDPIDYPAEGGDDGDDEMDVEEDEDDDMDIEAEEEDEDDEMDVEIDEEAEEEHLAPAYPVVVALPATVPSAEETEPFETDESAATPPPHPAYRMTARITIPEPLPVPAWSYSEVPDYFAISSPLSSPLSSWSSSPPQIPFPLSPPSPVLTAPPPSPIRSLGYRAATIRMRAEAAATSPFSTITTTLHTLTPPPDQITTNPCSTSAPNSFPPLHREEQTLELGAHMREFESMVRRDTDEIYTRLDDEQGQRQLLAGRVNMLFRDRRTHAHTRQLMETEAGMSREAWGRAMDASDLAHGGVISLRTTVHAQMSEITELQSADRRRQRAMSDLLETDRRRREEMRELRAADRTRQQQIIQTLTAVQTLQRETIPLQGLVTTLQGQVTALQGQVMTLQGQVTVLQGQQGPAGGPAQPGLPEDTGSSS